MTSPEANSESGEPYRVTVDELVSQLAIPRIQVDTVLDVHVHPTIRGSS